MLKDGHLIRSLHFADIPRVLEIEQASYPFPWTEGIFKDCIRVGYHCYVLETGEVLAGYAIFSVAVEECHVLNVCVDPARRRHGLGRVLLNHIFECAGELGAKLVYLEVRPSNRAAIDLYASLGFEKIATRRRYYPAFDGREDALVLARVVDPQRP